MKAKLISAIEKIREKHGKNAIAFGDESKRHFDIKKWSTGIAEVDEMLDGGMPESRIVEIWGQEGAGKTSLCYQSASRHNLSYWCDGEGTADMRRAIGVFGIKKKSVLLEQPDSGEDAFESIYEMVKAHVPLVVIDSVPTLIPHKVHEKAKSDLNRDTYASVAALLSKCMPILITHMKNSPSTVIFVNQVRDNIGIMFGDKFTLPGGHALKHYKALSIQVQRSTWIGEKDKRLGQMCMFRVTKSKVSYPFRTCMVPLLFNKGFVPYDEAMQDKEVKKAILKISKRQAGGE